MRARLAGLPGWAKAPLRGVAVVLRLEPSAREKRRRAAAAAEAKAQAAARRAEAKREARRQHVEAMKRLGETISEPEPLEVEAASAELTQIRESYRVDGLITEDGRVPLVWWTNAPNYGDDLSPWLFGQMTGLPVKFARNGRPSYIAVGSVARRVRDESIVWGSGSFGTEPDWELNAKADYRAVRGPLTRSRLLNVGADCPRVYGDPALIMPLYFNPKVEKEYEVGVIVRWSEAHWRKLTPGPGVKLIDFKTADIKNVTREILSCKRIISSSLHGLVIADAYGIPNAWLESDSKVGGSRPKGGEFKFYDYFLSVEKSRHAQTIELHDDTLTVENLLAEVEYDGREIEFDYRAYLDSCPFLTRVDQ